MAIKTEYVLLGLGAMGLATWYFIHRKKRPPVTPPYTSAMYIPR